MELHEAAMQILGMAREMRNHMWTEHKTTEIQTQLSVLRQGKEEWETVPDVVMVLAASQVKDTSDLLREVLRIPHEWDDWNGYKQIVFVTDGYGRKIDGLEKTEVLPDNGKTNLETEYKTNPATDVMRVCTVFIAQDDLVGGAEACVGFQPWHVTDGGVLEYGKAHVRIDDLADNSITGTLKEAINDRP